MSEPGTPAHNETSLDPAELNRQAVEVLGRIGPETPAEEAAHIKASAVVAAGALADKDGALLLPDIDINDVYMEPSESGDPQVTVVFRRLLLSGISHTEERLPAAEFHDALQRPTIDQGNKLRPYYVYDDSTISPRIDEWGLSSLNGTGSDLPPKTRERWLRLHGSTPEDPVTSEAEKRSDMTYFERLLWNRLERVGAVSPDQEPNRDGIQDGRDAQEYVFAASVGRAIQEMPNSYDGVTRLDDLAAMARWSTQFRNALADAIEGNDLVGRIVRDAGYTYNDATANYENPDADQDQVLSPWRLAGPLAALDPADRNLDEAREAGNQILREAYDAVRNPALLPVPPSSPSPPDRGPPDAGSAENNDRRREFTSFDDRVLQNVRQMQRIRGVDTPDSPNQDVADLRQQMDTLAPEDRRRVIDDAMHLYSQTFLSDENHPPAEILETVPALWDVLEAMAQWNPDFRRALRQELSQHMPSDELMDVHFDDSVQPPLFRSITSGQRIPVWQVVSRLRERAESSRGAHDRMSFGEVTDLVDQAYKTAWQASHDRRREHDQPARRAGRRLLGLLLRPADDES